MCLVLSELVRVMKRGLAAHVFLIAYDVWIAKTIEVLRLPRQLNHLLLFLLLVVCVSFDALTNGGDRLRSLLKQIQSLSLVF